jgi:hypothetical protein
LSIYLFTMDDTNPHPAPADWLAVIEDSEADLAAGRIVSGDALLSELRATTAEMERAELAQPSGGASVRL